MKMNIRIIPDDNLFKSSIIYTSDEILTSYFLLNRDFVINKLICDDIEIIPEFTLVEFLGFNYTLKRFTIPNVMKNMYIEYTGFLSGKTGCCPYVREKITPEFSFIRWETFCYPFFCENNADTLYSYLSIVGKADIKITVPNSFDVVASEVLTSKVNNGQEIDYCYINNHSQKNNFSCSVAKYRKINTNVGVFYLLNKHEQLNLEEVMLKVHTYMNEHFGTRNIDSNTKYAAIPDGFGSFVVQEVGVVYIQESTFNSIKDLHQIIHEFIHLGWNAKADQTSQRIRFFDEAFTCYFELRVMDYLMGEKYMLNRFVNAYKRQMNSGKYKNIPICEFGMYEYGDLSYTIGAIFLNELCNILGEDCFDKITTLF